MQPGRNSEQRVPQYEALTLNTCTVVEDADEPAVGECSAVRTAICAANDRQCAGLYPRDT